MYKSQLITCLLILAALFPNYLSSQNFVDVIQIGYRHETPNRLQNGTGEFQTHNLLFDVNVPIPLSDKSYLLAGLSGNRLSLVLNRDDNTNDYSAVALRLGWRKIWNDKFTTSIIAIPKYSGQLAEGTLNSFQMGGILLTEYKKSDTFTWKWGVYYNAEFFGPFLVPIVGFNWQLSDQLLFTADLPIRARLSFSATDDWKMGFMFRGIVGSYRIQDSGQYLEQVNNLGALFMEYYLTPKLVLQGKAGLDIGRTFRFYEENEKVDARISLVRIGDDRDPIDLNVKDSPMLEVRLIYRIDTSNR
ncbi:MAG: DUF6268 family outer membrane beta-barrel protein [Bacteroidota bacterium]